MDDITPPELNWLDHFYALFFALVSTIPVVGPTCAEALKGRWPSKFEKDLTKWRAAITEREYRTDEILRAYQSVEEGLTASGRYRRFGDGALEVEKSIKIEHEYSDTIMITFPAWFVRPPRVDLFDVSHALEVSKVSSSGATIKLIGQVYRGTISFRYQATGRWR